MGRSNKCHLEPHRADIEQRTTDGESCEAIASALRARGVEVSAKTISRYRVGWGIRQRRQPSTKGRKYPNRKSASTSRTNTAGPANSGKKQQQSDRRQEITERTQRGETAEQIAAALAAQGMSMTKGVSTVTRLQTYWGLIPYDNARARGKYSEAFKAKTAARANGPRGKRAPRRPKEKFAPSDPSQILHYPNGLSFGSQRHTVRIAPRPRSTSPRAGVVSSDHPIEADTYESSSGDMVDEHAQATQPPINVAAELMSVDFLVDLATTTLSAAQRLKELYIAQQQQRPLPRQTTIPTDVDIAAAKKKVREAAAVMHDLALPGAMNAVAD